MLVRGFIWVMVGVGFLFADRLQAEELVCARVKIEIRQELTLERQGFDAHMRIVNGLSHVTLEDAAVEVLFTDAEGKPVKATSDPNDTSALFFIRLSSLENIGDVSGTGRVNPETTADIHWLIVPAPGAAKGLESGTLYYVGARLTYTIGGELKKTEVSPDYIFVKPMPTIALDYFLPSDVYGDDPLTAEIEPIVPFALGVRAKNNGSGTARNLRIDSAQPRIVENAQGLLIGFSIEGSEVNGSPATNSLQVALGDIAPNRCANARWIMSCTLSGKFVDFQAVFSHADELGGQLTSLITQAATHFLVRDVLVDLPGRDGVRDFLAADGDVLRVYESEGIDTVAVDQSAAAALTLNGLSANLIAPPTAGFFHVRLTDPFAGTKVLGEVVRTDGKRVKPENAWLSKTFVKGAGWQYFLHLFDANTPGGYTLLFAEPTAGAQAPVLQPVSDRVVVEGEALGFLVQASDPNGTVPYLSAAPLPAGATFTDRKNGSGVFDWKTAPGQAGRYEITFTATDGKLSASRRAAITVRRADDTDGDGMNDAWELAHFGTLARDGSGDFDMDGVSDRDEFLAGTDPAKADAPPVPVIAAPLPGARVPVPKPTLTVEPSLDPDGDPVLYRFELYADEALTELVSQSQAQAGPAWQVPQQLVENRWYTWRVRAADGYSASLWAYGRFFVDAVNEPPGPPRVSRPADGTEVGVLRPLFEVTNSGDPDEDALGYRFEIYADPAGSLPVSAWEGLPAGKLVLTFWRPGAPLADQTRYHWRAVVTDPHGLAGATALTAVRVAADNHAPPRPEPLTPAAGGVVAVTALELAAAAAADSDGDLVACLFEVDTVATFDSPALRRSEMIHATANTTTWPIGGLSDHTRYFWRVKSSDGLAESPWSLSEFFVNRVNDAPGVPAIRNPGPGAWVETLTPVLELAARPNPDRDAVAFRFEVYADAALTERVAEGTTDGQGWTVAPALADRTRYFWRARAEDEWGAKSAWSPAAAFVTRENPVDDPPAITILSPSAPIATRATRIAIAWTDADPDSNAEISLYFDTNGQGADGVLIQDGLREDPDGSADSFTWDTAALPDGTYYIYAVITDGTTTRVAYAPAAITIDRTPPAVAALPAGGSFTAAQSVRLSATEPAEIYYTLDGSLPSEDSELYAGALTLARSATLRFMALDAAGNRSPTVTETYVIAPQTNQAPLADAGSDFSIHLGETAELDGTGSRDPDGGPQPLSFSWRFLELPAQSTLTDADLRDAGAAAAHFVPDAAGDYVLELAVDDGRDISRAEVVVTCLGYKPGDLNHDGKIDMGDYLLFKASLGKCSGQAGFNAEADYDGDGCVTLSDYRIWYGHYRNQ